MYQIFFCLYVLMHYFRNRQTLYSVLFTKNPGKCFASNRQKVTVQDSMHCFIITPIYLTLIYRLNIIVGKRKTLESSD